MSRLSDTRLGPDGMPLEFARECGRLPNGLPPPTLEPTEAAECDALAPDPGRLESAVALRRPDDELCCRPMKASSESESCRAAAMAGGTTAGSAAAAIAAGARADAENRGLASPGYIDSGERCGAVDLDSIDGDGEAVVDCVGVDAAGTAGMEGMENGERRGAGCAG